jgi:hypothetical protein
MAVEKSPSRKYLMAASLESLSCRLNPVRMYTAIDISSMPTKRVVRSMEAEVTIIPRVHRARIA